MGRKHPQHAQQTQQTQQTIVLWLLALAAGCGSTAATDGSRAPVYGSIGGESSRAGYEVREARQDGSEPGGLAMAAEQGAIDREDAEAAIKQSWRRLVGCYAEAGEARDFAGGPVTLRFAVGVEGRTLEVHVLSSALGSFEVERSLVGVASGIRFPRPHGHARATVEYSLEFRSTGEVPVLEVSPEAAEPALPLVLTRLASECGALGVDEVTATLYADRKGTVRSVGFGSRRPFPGESAACVARTLRGTAIPLAIEGGALGRTVLALRDSDVRNPPALAKAKKKRARVTQGRRRPSRR